MQIIHRFLLSKCIPFRGRKRNILGSMQKDAVARTHILTQYFLLPVCDLITVQVNHKLRKESMHNMESTRAKKSKPKGASTQSDVYTTNTPSLAIRRHQFS